MIRLLREDEIPRLIPLCENDALGCRIGSALLCYQGASFLDVWVQEDDGGIQAVLGRLDGAMTILDVGKPDRPEQRAFCEAVGFSSLTASCCGMEELGFPLSASGVILTAGFSWNGFANNSEPKSKQAEYPFLLRWGGSPRFYYPILEQCQGDGIQLPPFDGWYVDCSHRMRRGWMRGGILQKDGVDAGCILAVETPRAALITGVAVLPPFRRIGLGKRLVASLLAAVRAEGKKCFLLCRPGLVSFYGSLGFEPYGQWASYTPPCKEVSV